MTESRPIYAAFVGRRPEGVAGAQFGGETVLIDAAWEAFDTAHPPAPGELVLPPGRYPVQRLVVLDASDASSPDAQPPAQRAVALLPFVPALDAQGSVEVLQVLAELADETQVLQSRGWLARDLAGALPG